MAATVVVSVSMGVMKPVLAKLTTLMGNEYKKLKGLRKKVTFLQRELSEMDALLEKMDSADELDPQAKKWRKDIIEMSYNIEDCIDDFMNCVGEANEKMGILRKAFKYLTTFRDRRHQANQLQEIKARVMEASERRKRYMLDQSISITAPVVVDPRLSAIYKESASLVGIDAQKLELVTGAMEEEMQLKIMAIVGLGGLGKTTLANEVYREVGEKFDRKAFVSVSQKPDMIGLFNSLLLQLGIGTYSHACQVQDPINSLRGHLQDKRFFIVVDDLWDTKAWGIIQCAFPQNNQCSRVMITTRNENVAKSCCDNHRYIHNMEPLSEEDSEKLFFDRIFGPENACPSELRKASSKILKKCDGLPLAIITMASMLACQPRRFEGQWEYIYNSLSSKFATNSRYEEMMYILDMSYKNLPRHLKACFLYLGSYPEDHKIDRVELVRRWVAEGFVTNSNGQDVWDAAESYFNELVNRSMIQPTYHEYTTGISSCRVHDMLLELIVRRCKEDNFLSLVNDSDVVVEAQDKVIRRLTLVGLRGIEDGKVDVTTAGKLSQIRSLTILKVSNWMLPPLQEFRFVRVLSLNFYWGPDAVAMDLTIINQLSQLRYVKMTGDNGRGIVLYGQIRRLRLLETLDLLSETEKQDIPLQLDDALRSLQPDYALRLSHLVMPRGTRLPDWIGKVKSLRTLRGFSLPMDSLEGIIGLGELTALSDLRLCFPKVCAGSSKAATLMMTALSASLGKLGNLRRLALSPDTRVALCADALMMSSLLSPPFGNLEVLYLQRGCTFSRVPTWIGAGLHDLRLGAKQLLQEDVDILGTKLPSLVLLHLRIPAGVPMERIVIGGFPALERFVFDCDWISHLAFEAGAMPKLRKLELIFDADEWDKAAPAGLQHLPSLKTIRANRAWCDKVPRILTASIYEREAEDALIRGVFQEVADALPTRPAFTLDGGFLFRPMELEAPITD